MRPSTEVGAALEFEILTTEPGRALMAEVAGTPRPSPADLTRWRKGNPADRVHAAIRLAEGRRRGAAKFARADRMWFEPTALEQATPEAVARHKAERFAGADVIDLCCGIGGDALALGAVAARVAAVDLDPGMARRAAWNARAYGVEHAVLPVIARAEGFGLSRSSLVHIDPDRRAKSRTRAKAVAGYAPGLDFLRDLPSRCRGGAIKLGPASDFEDHFAGPGVEVEVVSLGGECKEACVWFGDLATVARRATCLPSGASWTDAAGGRRAAVAPVGAWLFEPDAALVRAGLADGFAIAHDLARVAPGIALFSGPSRIDSPWLSAFAVEATMAPDWRVIRSESARLGLRPYECKTRGLPEFRPETLHQKLRVEGGRPATLFLLRDDSGGRAILATRHEAPASPSPRPDRGT